MLAALSRAALARLRFPLGELTKPAGARARRARPASTSPASPTRRTSASSPAPGRANFLARHGGMRSRPGDIVDRAGAVTRPPRRPPRLHRRPAQGPARRRPTQPLYVLATDARANTVTVGPRERARDAAPSRVRGLRLHGEPDAVRLRYRSPACRLPPGRHRIHLDEPFDGAAPGQTAVFLRRGRDRRMRHNRPDALQRSTHRRDPRDVPALLREPRPQAAAVGVARAVRLRPLGAADDGRHAPARAVLPRRGEAAAPAPDDRARSAFARPTSTTSATPRAT